MATNDISWQQPPLDLPDVTLVAATSIGLDATVRALEKSMLQARFGKVMLLSDRRPSDLREDISWTEIAPIRSKADYSRFMLRDLAAHVTSGHALCVQWDGYAINAGGWDPIYLDFDYIGAVWPHFSDGHNVGNGGFSLRSRRLLEATRTLPYDGRTPEDIVIGRMFRPELERDGIRFASEPIARRFSFERSPPSGREFGFHGAFNLVNLVTARDAFRLLQSLETQVLTQQEHKELLRWAVRRGYLVLVSLLVKRLWRQRMSTR